MESTANDDVWHNVLAENTAQTVLKHLNKLVSGAARYRKRWIWELLQNARDTAPDGGVRIEVELKPHCVSFRHNGTAFTPNNIAHLIYHGSTKHEEDEAIGHFGSGFITTHLISRQIGVRGRMTDGSTFDFTLDRRGDTARALKDAMDGSRSAFELSLSRRQNTSPQITAEYIYQFDKEVAHAVQDGVLHLKQQAPFVLAFNNRINSIRAIIDGNETLIQRKDVVSIADNLKIVSIEHRTRDTETRYIALTEQEGIAVAVELRKGEGGWAVVEMSDVPRLFIAFPLMGSEDFCLPAVVNSTKFVPAEDRDSLALTDEPANLVNRELMETCFDLAARLAMLAASQKWDNAAQLALFPQFREREWVDTDWIRTTARQRIIDPLRKAHILQTEEGSFIPPETAWLPISDQTNVSGIKDIWSLANRIRKGRGRIPRETETELWANILTRWAAISGNDSKSFSEHFDLSTVCSFVCEYPNISQLSEALADRVNTFKWLNCLFELIIKNSMSGCFDKLDILPNQMGDLTTRAELKRDQGIDEELKAVAEGLGARVRTVLLDSRIKAVRDLLEARDTEQVLAEALQRIKDGVDSDSSDDTLKQSSIELFAWIVRGNRLKSLDGFPVFMQKAKDSNCWEFLSKAMVFSDTIPLAPARKWRKEMRPFATMFAKQHILAEEYGAVGTNKTWLEIQELGYMRLDPLYKSSRLLETFIPDDPLPEKDEQNQKIPHRTKEAVEVLALAYFEKDDTIDLIQKSQKRGIELLQFVVSQLITDGSAFHVPSAECICGKVHRYYYASWLIPLWERKWIALGEGKTARASAESLAQLLRDNGELLRSLTNGIGTKFLDALRISVADLLLRTIARNEEKRVEYIGFLSEMVRAVGEDSAKIRLLAAELNRSPEIFDHIQRRNEEREKVMLNQAVGAAVESILSGLLRESPMNVQRTGIGSDFEVGNDFVENGQEVLLELSSGKKCFLIEIKSTFAGAVRMTVPQARSATAQPECFVLCYVRLFGADISQDAVAKNARFIVDIGERLAPIWSHYNQIMESKSRACHGDGEIELVQSGEQTRFSIGVNVWEQGMTLQQVLEFFKKPVSRKQVL